MIQSFRGKGTADVFHGKDSKAARKVLPSTLGAVARRKLDQLNQAAKLDDLRVPPRNMLEPLKGDRRGQHSIRINELYRICFVWSDSGPEQAEIVDYH
jgi:proteic killer suppression protein